MQGAEHRQFERFWKPFLVCIPSPEVYRVYGTEKQTLLRAFDSRPPVPPDQPPMSAFAGSRDLAYTSRLSSITSFFADLNTGPSVIVGAETNQWHAELIRGGRYRVTKVGGKSMVQDIQSQRAVYSKPYSWEPVATYDCAAPRPIRHWILSRLPNWNQH